MLKPASTWDPCAWREENGRWRFSGTKNLSPDEERGLRKLHSTQMVLNNNNNKLPLSEHLLFFSSPSVLHHALKDAVFPFYR
jgi:hypothetical protein